MANYEKLTKAGIDVENLLKRIMGNASLIKLFVGKFTQDVNYSTLVEALGEKDAAKAEMASHTLKGMCGNMSLSALYKLFTLQTELLRGGEFEAAEALMGEISPAYGAAILNMREWLEEN